MTLEDPRRLALDRRLGIWANGVSLLTACAALLGVVYVAHVQHSDNKLMRQQAALTAFTTTLTPLATTAEACIDGYPRAYTDATWRKCLGAMTKQRNIAKQALDAVEITSESVAVRDSALQVFNEYEYQINGPANELASPHVAMTAKPKKADPGSYTFEYGPSPVERIKTELGTLDALQTQYEDQARRTMQGK